MKDPKNTNNAHSRLEKTIMFRKTNLPRLVPSPLTGEGQGEGVLMTGYRTFASQSICLPYKVLTAFSFQPADFRRYGLVGFTHPLNDK